MQPRTLVEVGLTLFIVACAVVAGWMWEQDRRVTAGLFLVATSSIASYVAWRWQISIL